MEKAGSEDEKGKGSEEERTKEKTKRRGPRPEGGH